MTNRRAKRTSFFLMAASMVSLILQDFTSITPIGLAASVVLFIGAGILESIYKTPPKKRSAAEWKQERNASAALVLVVSSTAAVCYAAGLEPTNMSTSIPIILAVGGMLSVAYHQYQGNQAASPENQGGI
ncbi:hypothetical protein [Alkalicoccus urumqiensis]|uniref:DUF2178 domain-containing protein n=1 Tax=Alkalicoccus urumqiensis TaxID=1548213 RepID=A0A2P6MJA8_ALKUR|nr:hypothetical protein [Alkalicoccus urumqiensis]PRO66340.1 hypothetical protein C6I21_05930 [Alkalicoccus urumqiensis]